MTKKAKKLKYFLAFFIFTTLINLTKKYNLKWYYCLTIILSALNLGKEYENN